MTLILSLIVLGVIFYFIDMIPMAAPFPAIVKAVAVIIAIVLVLQYLGVNVPLHLN